MGFEPLDAGAMGAGSMSGFSLEDLAETPPPPPPQFQPQVTPNMPSPGQVAVMDIRRYGPPVVIGGAIGYFVYGWTGALIGALVAGVGYYFLIGYVMAQVLSGVLRTG